VLAAGRDNLTTAVRRLSSDVEGMRHQIEFGGSKAITPLSRLRLVLGQVGLRLIQA
jgi:hypothetical protein